MHSQDSQHRTILVRVADKAMVEWELLPDFSRAAKSEAARLTAPASADSDSMRDLRALLWCSIDNDDSEDLDQLTVAEALPDDKMKIYVAIADVDALIREGSAINQHAEHNTTSVYTAAKIYPMLPEKLSTGLTSLNEGEDRVAMVVEMLLAPDGSLLESDVYRALVHNQAKLAYNGIDAWLENRAPMPPALAAVPGLAENLRLQDHAAQDMRGLRHAQGALSLETIQARARFDGERLASLEPDEVNRAKQIIENFMIGANGVTARYLADHGFPSIRRVVRVPKRWDRIVDLAAEYGHSLPPEPDSGALENFLVERKSADPLRFPDISLAVVKLLGSGEYVADLPEDQPLGHFGLAVRDYAHSTAPNRRYPDLLTQRLLKAALTHGHTPYSKDRLDELAQHCTEAEDAATKVERRVQKSAAALLLEDRIGEQFNGIITGAADKGTWVRLIDIPVEGKLVHGYQGLDVGDRVRVQLLETDVERGFIDFGLVAAAPISKPAALKG